MMFRCKIYYDGTVFYGEEEWETEQEAIEDAEMFIESKIADWEADGISYERELFSYDAYMCR